MRSQKSLICGWSVAEWPCLAQPVMELLPPLTLLLLDQVILTVTTPLIMFIITDTVRWSWTPLNYQTNQVTLFNILFLWTRFRYYMDSFCCQYNMNRVNDFKLTASAMKIYVSVILNAFSIEDHLVDCICLIGRHYSHVSDLCNPICDPNNSAQ